MHTCTLVHKIVLYCMRLHSREEVILASQLHEDTKLRCSLLHAVPDVEVLCSADAIVAYLPYPIRYEPTPENNGGASCRGLEYCLVSHLETW